MIIDIGILINKNISDISGYRKVPVLIQGAEHLPPSPKEVPQVIPEDQRVLYFKYIAEQNSERLSFHILLYFSCFIFYDKLE